ncbi:hypothetical protein PUN71_022190 [Arthrobacter sp. NQ7]|uniref:hypothetical protein n=1 Tax=Arthrobacter sp. NQ7 TaxID=3032303 RepID=UPI00240FD11E|nr:hypothetical protein [Arthrobacter sp. NQ7]MDJ0459921.1 hypothetical protein [Arthrobacter sp. NQ7]
MDQAPAPALLGAFACYRHAFAAAEEFRNAEDTDVRIFIINPIITKHPRTDATGGDALLGQTAGTNVSQSRSA